MSENMLTIIDSKRMGEIVSDFNQPMSQYFTQIGLPVDEVLYSVDDRMKVLNSFESAIESLPIEQIGKSIYLTRFGASIAAGLFDGALTYLWNETIQSIRKMVIDFDLVHFYAIASQYSSRYKGLIQDDELEKVSEYDLISICNRIGLLDNHVYEIFKHINYMRNHSSAAHPTEHRIRPFDILSWLDNCIEYAINAKPNTASIQVKRLLHNVRNDVIPAGDYSVIGADIQKLPQTMIDDLLNTLFCTFTDKKVKSETINNIRGISPYAWDASSESKKYEIGEKYGYFRKNGEVPRKELCDSFLTIVSGQGYKDEDSIAAEIRETLNNLKTAHYGTYNFYSEYPWAIQLQNIIPSNGQIPHSVEKEWIRIITICYIGNGLGYREGVDESAEVYYRDFINNFTELNVYQLLYMLDDSELTRDMDYPNVGRRFKNLCKTLKDRTANIFMVQALDYIINFRADLEKMHMDTKFKSLISKIVL